MSKSLPESEAVWGRIASSRLFGVVAPDAPGLRTDRQRPSRAERPQWGKPAGRVPCLFPEYRHSLFLTTRVPCTHPFAPCPRSGFEPSQPRLLRRSRLGPCRKWVALVRPITSSGASKDLAVPPRQSPGTGRDERLVHAMPASSTIKRPPAPAATDAAAHQSRPGVN